MQSLPERSAHGAVAVAAAPPDGHAAPAAPSVSERVAADGTQFILATFVDLTGKPCAKLVPASAAGMLETASARELYHFTSDHHAAY